MKIEVKERHILTGKRDDCSSCPIALSIFEKTGLPIEVAGDDDIHIGANNYVVANDDIDKVSKFICDFDKGERVQPIDFEIIPREMANDVRPDFSWECDVE